MPAGQGSDPEARDVERLADALDRGGSPDSVDDPALAHDLRLVELMRVFGPDPTLAPAPDARDRARARLRAAMAEQARARVPEPSPVPAPVSAEATARFAVRSGGGTTTSVTAEFQRIVADDAADGPGAGGRGAGAPGAEREDGGGTAAPRSRRSRAAAPARPAGRSGASARPPRGGIRRRAAAVVLASLVALVAVAVGGDLASRGALPGDALYAIKRVSEDVGVATTSDDRARAQRHLALATTRVDEVEQLVERDGAGGADAAVVEGVIADFDASTDEGTRTLLEAPEAPGPAELDGLQTWASDQAARLSVLRPALPVPALDRVDGSLALLDRLVGRTRELGARPTPTLPGAPGDGAAGDGTGGATGPGAVPGGTGTGPDGPTGGGTGTGTGGGTGGTPDGARPDTGTAPRTPGGGGSTAPSTARPAPDEPSDGGLLPGIDTGDLPLLPDDGGSDAPPDEDDGDVSLPLPVLPPVEVPTLLPGQPGLSIG